MAAISRDLAKAEQEFRSGNLGLAEKLLKRVLVTQPANSRANELMAYIAGNRGDIDGVFRFLENATRSPNASQTSWYYLGVWFQRKGNHLDAVTALQKSLEIDGPFFEALHDLGVAFFHLGEAAKAVEAYDRAAAINPDSFELFHNKGRALQALQCYDEALACYDRALALNPGHAASWFNRGETLNCLKRYDEALAAYGKALALKPDYPDVHWNESLTRLVLGQFEVAWQKYEYRWKGEMAWPRRHTDIPAWLGEQPIRGKRILVWWEQGFGDTIHFCRYAPMLAREGAEVVLEVQPPLKGLVSSMEGCLVIADGDPFPDCDYQVPLLSLPLTFKTTLETIPASIPYLKADADWICLWEQRLNRAGGRMKIGIACAGNPGQKDNTQRSMALREFAPLEKLANLFLIQPQIGSDDQRFLHESDSKIEYVGNEIADFQDSAAIVANMDLVVTVDTSLAHLAGALGKPVWILLPWTPTWRWLVDRADSPWYPTATLFRQKEMGDWRAVMSDVEEALARLAKVASCY